MADFDTTLMKEIFDIPQRKGKTNVEHHSEADDLGASFEILEWRALCHPKRLGRCAAGLKRVLSDSASGRISKEERDRQAASLQAARAKELAVRPFLDRAYPAFVGALEPDDNTIICRCEEVKAGDIRGCAKIGCLGPNQAKAFGRAGMGPCQGRYCGLTVTALLAQANGLCPDDTGYYRIRPPLKPVTLGELASMDDTVPEVTE